MSDQYIKVGVDSTTKAVSAFVTIQGKNFAVNADGLDNSKNSAAATTATTTANIELSNITNAAGAVTTAATGQFSGSASADPLALLDKAIASVDKFRSSLGAVQNRLSSAVTNLNNTTTNLSEAQSRIQDADYATEVSNMSKAQIVQQAGNSVLSKANQVPQQVLSLLQG